MFFFSNTVPAGCPTDDIQWLRPDEIYDEEGDKPVFMQGLEANDVVQSSFLGNCWFVSGLSIVATKDDLIIGKFKPTAENLK